MTVNKTLMSVMGAAAFVLAAAGTPALAATGNAMQSTTKLDGSQYLKDAHVTLAQARAMALKAYPGTITSEELEKEAGGAGLRYSFDIKNSAGVTHEVGVDALNGSILENNAEGPNAD